MKRSRGAHRHENQETRIHLEENEGTGNGKQTRTKLTDSGWRGATAGEGPIVRKRDDTGEERRENIRESRKGEGG